MKDASENPNNGLARVDQTAPNMPVKADGSNRRSAPMKRVNQRPSGEELTPRPISDTGKIKAELENALAPVLQEIADGEYNAAANVVNNLIPRVIAARSAQSEDRIAGHVRNIAEEVAIESLDTFSGVFASSQILLNSMADDLFDELCPV